MELKELLSDFSLKPFVRPTPTTQSHYRNAPSADGRSASLVPKRKGCLARRTTAHNERPGAQSINIMVAIGPTKDVLLISVRPHKWIRLVVCCCHCRLHRRWGEGCEAFCAHGKVATHRTCFLNTFYKRSFSTKCGSVRYMYTSAPPL